MSNTPKIVIAIDAQKEYTTPGRPLHIVDIEPSVAKAKELLEGVREAGVPVWHVKHLHNNPENPVFLEGGEHSEFIKGFEPKAGERVYTKDLYSSFSAPGFAEDLAEVKPEEIMVIGYGTAMCNLCTIIDGIHRGHSFTLVEDAVAAKAADGNSEAEMHKSAVNVLRQFAQIKSVNDVLQGLK